MEKLGEAIQDNFQVKFFTDVGVKMRTITRFYGTVSSAQLAASSLCQTFDIVHRMALAYHEMPPYNVHKATFTRLARSDYALGVSEGLEYHVHRELRRQKMIDSTFDKQLVVFSKSAAKNALSRMGVKLGDRENSGRDPRFTKATNIPSSLHFYRAFQMSNAMCSI